jgi:hypothetical protein
VEANLIAHRRIVGRFVASGSVEKGKSVGKTEQSPKNPSGSYHFRSGQVPLSTCLKMLEKNLNLYLYKITLQDLRPDDSERRLEYCNWFLNNLNDNRFVIMN